MITPKPLQFNRALRQESQRRRIYATTETDGALRAMRKLRHLDLFSGIGGFSLGLEATGGFETIGFSEIDPWCCAVLKKHWPKVKNYGDIGTIRRKINCDIITGGFPCQPFSCAGKREGAKDDRHLWPSMRDVIALYRPAWVICENVPGIIPMELDNCCLDLEDLGYTAQPIIIPALAVESFILRERLWFVAVANEINGQVGMGNFKIRKKQILKRNLSSRPRSWEKAASKFLRVDDGLPSESHESRIACIGNSIHPEIPKIFGEIILQTYASSI